MTTSEKRPYEQDAARPSGAARESRCPKGQTDYEACFAPFRYCPEKGCNKVSGVEPVDGPTSVQTATTRRERVARAIAEAADDGVFDRDEPDCTSDDEDRDYWRRLADAAIAAYRATDENGPSSTEETS